MKALIEVLSQCSQPTKKERIKTMNSYTKLQSGAWGVRVEGTATPGKCVTVQTKAGALKTETVERVLWFGPDKRHPGVMISLCAIAPRAAAVVRGGRGDGWTGCRTGCRCGSIEGQPRSSDCAECRNDY
jgi:hypothetical protein